MRSPEAGFVISRSPEPHRARTKGILQKHPEIRNLIGKNPYTALAILGVVTLQFGAAAFVADRPWWALFLVAYVVGAFADHGLYVLIHDCAHNLVFKRKAMNSLISIVANLPQVVPSAISFQQYHLKHHAFQGIYDLDADLPSHWEARLVGRSFLGKALWLALFPVAQMLRPLRLKEIALFDRWTVLNIVVVVAADVAVFAALGPKAFVYLVASLFFSIGLHPLGARWIQRHYMVDQVQETYSYYGGLNRLAFNVGHHNEHHDFPSVPWNRLPRIKSTAPEWYETLVSHRSWTRLLFKFLTDRKLSLYSRMVRADRAGVRFDDDVTPDLDIIESQQAPTPQSVAGPSEGGGLRTA